MLSRRGHSDNNHEDSRFHVNTASQCLELVQGELRAMLTPVFQSNNYSGYMEPVTLRSKIPPKRLPSPPPRNVSG